MINLKDLKTEDDLKNLIIEDLGYTHSGERPFPFTCSDDRREKVLLSKIVAHSSNFQIVYIKIATSDSLRDTEVLMRGLEREIIHNIDKYQRNNYLVVTSSEDGSLWHFVNPRTNGSRLELRRFTIDPLNREKLRTTTDRLSLIKVSESDTLQSLIDKHREAFDVEAVTMKFFESFANKYLELIELIKKSHYSDNIKTVREVAQIILNRIVFLKFIEQKEWLDEDTDFLYNKFQPYYTDNNNYWIDVIVPLFYLLSNSDRSKFSEIGKVPFLNGGLFGNEPEEIERINIPNSYFQQLFEELLNKFNFTIEESSPSSVEVAVDPEMLGRIFEELVLRMEKTLEKSEEEFGRELRRSTGSYYTPRIAVYYMCREAISRRVSVKSGVEINKVKQIIDFSLDETPDDEQLSSVDISLPESQSVLRVVEEISICDPAVGSGAFLLGALQILVGIKKFMLDLLEDTQRNDKDFEYSLKESTIKSNLIGVDILRQAVHICELRLWLSLAVDYENKSGKTIPTLPNLTYKIYCGDSIVDHLYGEPLEGFRSMKDFSSNSAIKQQLDNFINKKNSYFSETGEENKHKKEKQITEEKLKIAIQILQQETRGSQLQIGLEGLGKNISTRQIESAISNEAKQELINKLKAKLQSGNFSLAQDKLSFAWMIDLVEFFVDHGKGGFDIVIGNPPYGVTSTSMSKGKSRYRLGSADSYGVFMAMVITDLLKEGGVISFITSDTWQTIQSHRQLRRLFLDNSLVHQIIMMPGWLFGATVNTSILIASKKTLGKIKKDATNTRGMSEIDSSRINNEIVACDFTRAKEKEGDLEEWLSSLDIPEYAFTPIKACYHYNQGLIEINTNNPFFIGSPKLFTIMNDVSTTTTEKEIGENIRKKVSIRQVKVNDEIIDLVRLGDVAEVKQGLATGDNKSYLFQYPEARGSYRSINEYKQFLLTSIDFKKINNDDRIRGKIIEIGIHKSKTEAKFDPDCWFDGRYIVPYDKGGESDTESGWLPNYYVPTNYFIDWSQQALARMKTLTIGQREGTDRSQIASVLRNIDYSFLPNISSSRVGEYSPTFRKGSSSAFDSGCGNLFSVLNHQPLLGILCSKMFKLLFKIGLNHTVNSQVDDAKEVPIPYKENSSIGGFVSQIIEKQKNNPRYDYLSNEQKKIDKLVYKAYGLNKDDIKEVETWYARRYPKLARFCDID